MPGNLLFEKTENHSISDFENKLFQRYKPTPPYFAVKQVYATVSCDLEDLDGFIAAIETNLAAIMAEMEFNGDDFPFSSGFGLSQYAYDFDANPSFDITKGAITTGGNGGYINSKLQAFLQATSANGIPGAPGPAPSTTPIGGYLPYPSPGGWSTDNLATQPPFPAPTAGSSGFISPATAITAYGKFQIQAADGWELGSQKQLMWIWAYYPQYPPGTVFPLYTTQVQINDNFETVFGDLISVKPGADVRTPTVGSVFKLPSPPWNGPIFGSDRVLNYGLLYGIKLGGQIYIKQNDKPITGGGGAGGPGGGQSGSGGAGGPDSGGGGL